jgi:hypothetical protein
MADANTFVHDWMDTVLTADYRMDLLKWLKA